MTVKVDVLACIPLTLEPSFKINPIIVAITEGDEGIETSEQLPLYT